MKKTKGQPNLTVNEGDNAIYTMQSLYIATLPKININDVREVAERSRLYFESCIDKDLKPTVAGYALALGMDRMHIVRIISGEVSAPDDVRELISTFHRMLTAQMEDYMSNNKINPVAGIFLMRNNMGYTNDETLTIRAEREQVIDAATLIEKANALPIEMNDYAEED